MRSHRITVWSVITVLVVAGCTSGGGNGGDDAASDAPSMSDLTVEPEDAEGSAVSLSWPAVDGAERYRVGADHAPVDVPASVCADGECALAVDAALADGDGQLPVRTVTADGAVSEPAVAEVDGPTAPAPGPAADGEGPLEVVRVTPTGGAPEIEVLPAESAEEAESLLADTPASTEAALNTPVVPQSTGAPGTDPTDGPDPLATWSTEALRHDLLPGEPPGDGVVVAVVEAGTVDPTHPALADAVTDPLLVGSAGEAGAPLDDHATAAASLVAGRAEAGVPGAAPGATVLPVALGAEPTAADLMDGILRAVDAGADIINVSVADLACDGPEPASCDNLAAFETVAAHAAEQDAVIVAAAGNNGPGELAPGVPCAAEEDVNRARLPAALDSVITVGAHTSTGDPWACTPERLDVDVLAPGRNLLVARNGAGFGVESGSSLAAPAFAGLLAALRSEYPWLTAEAVRQRLPQWAAPGQRVDAVAALVDVGAIEPADAEELPEGVAAVHPYAFGLAFAPGHPVHSALDEAGQTPDLRVQLAWNQHPYVSSSTLDAREFGVVTGVIYLYEDGTAEATAAWDHSSLRNFVSDRGLARYVRGWSAACEYQHSRADTGLPANRAMVWDLTAEMTVTPTGEEDPAGWPTAEVAVEIGGPPEPVVTHDTWEECPGQIDATVAAVRRNVTVPFEEQDAQLERFFELGQEAHEGTVGSYRFEGVPIGSDAIVLNRDDADQPFVRGGFLFDFDR